MWVVADMCEEQLQVSGRFTQNFIACMDLPTLFTAVKPLPDYWRYVTNSSICVDGGVSGGSEDCGSDSGAKLGGVATLNWSQAMRPREQADWSGFDRAVKETYPCLLPTDLPATHNCTIRWQNHVHYQDIGFGRLSCREWM